MLVTSSKKCLQNIRVDDGYDDIMDFSPIFLNRHPDRIVFG